MTSPAVPLAKYLLPPATFTDRTSANASDPIEVTLAGMITPVNLEQPAKAAVPIELTLAGMITSVNWVHSANARCLMEVTPSGMVTEVAFSGQRIRVLLSLLNIIPNAFAESNVPAKTMAAAVPSNISMPYCFIEKLLLFFYDKANKVKYTVTLPTCQAEEEKNRSFLRPHTASWTFTAQPVSVFPFL
jgi:hypothetical protein